MSYKYKYSLNKENMYDLQVEAAYADKALKKKMVILLLNLLLIPSAFIVIWMDNKLFAFVISGIYCFACLFVFPFFYWKRIRKIIRTELEKTNLKFDDLFVEFTDKYISVIQQNSKFLINYHQVDGYRITKNNFMIYYHKNDKIDCLIIPYLMIEKEADEITKLIKDQTKERED